MMGRRQENSWKIVRKFNMPLMIEGKILTCPDGWLTKWRFW
jgi:hypothetical protein